MYRLGLLLAALLLVTLCLAGNGASPAPALAQPGEQINPYSAPAGLNNDQLIEYLERMQRKPRTIRRRPGFVAAVVDACTRVLENKPNPRQEETAAIVLMDVLHDQAIDGDEKAQGQLYTWAARLRKSQVKAVAQRARLHLLEQQVQLARAGRLTDAEISRLFEHLRKYCEETELTGRHLYLASEIVGLINSLGDRDAAERLYETFGQLFAKSKDKKLARYAKRKILKKSDSPLANLVGKPLELEGTTVDGQPFDWKQYRGKVVLVDFWATWCGPCVREMPNLLKAYEKYHERGFEVVGISLDQDREALEEFLKEHNIPWVTLFDEEAGGLHPMARKYGIRAIPAPILVDRQGKVIHTAARGQTLWRLLEKQFPEKP